MMDLVCYDCGRTADAGARCDCGEPRWLESDASAFDWDDCGDMNSLWRYADLLPVEPPDGVGAAAGGTPLVRTARLDEYAGCRLWVKDEAANPTGSFKDRGSAVGVARALENGQSWVGTVSHGNMATSMAAHAAGSGLNCLVLVPSDIPPERLVHVARYGPEIQQVEGDYGQLYYDSLDLSTDLPGVRFVNSDTPYRVAGQKTTTLEICEAFARGEPSAPRATGATPGESDTPEAPDAVVLPVSSGGHASAAWKALRELREAGVLDVDSVPRLLLVQTAACDPIAEAYRGGRDEVRPLADHEVGETVAYSIANAAPPSGNRALAGVRDTGGAVVSVPDDAIVDAKRQLARRAGLCVEPASATTLAGLRALAEAGEISPEESVVAVATGTGFRERTDSTGMEPATTTLADLSERVTSLVESG
jgi:threonine synthase